ncbi:hypothetical protein AAC387_Pa02g3474 [Persea americana]
MANQTLKLGPGLYQDGDAISVMKAGRLRFSKPKYWVESSEKRRERPLRRLLMDMPERMRKRGRWIGSGTRERCWRGRGNNMHRGTQRDIQEQL